MFKCMRNPAVAPTEMCPILLPNQDEYVKPNTAFVYMDGVGSQQQTRCMRDKNNFYAGVSYNSKGVVRDVINAKRNI